MPEITPLPLTLERDGTGQSARLLPSLIPESIGVDERSLSDLLAFSAEFAKELKYFDHNAQTLTSDSIDQDWSGFLNPLELSASDLQQQWREIEAFVAQPERFSDDSLHRRPHFVLFLSFLQLLGLSRQRLNQLPRQHLTYYFQTFLGLTKQRSQPDRVNVLVKLTADSSQALLPKGSLLDAGKDSQGGALHYVTDDDLVANRAQIKSLYSVFVDKKITGVKQAREACVETTADPMIAMFAIVYGDPIGAPAPDYLRDIPMDSALFGKIHDLVNFVANSLFFNFQELRTLMRYKHRREQTAKADWNLINEKLNIIGQQNVGANFILENISKDPWDFDANLKLALNDQAPDFDSLPDGIRSMEDLYTQRSNSDALTFIKTKFKLELDQFTAMMELKMAVDQDWRIVNGLLEAAGRRRQANFHLAKAPTSAHFDANLLDALGNLDFSAFAELLIANNADSKFEQFYSALSFAEKYFYCPLEDINQLTTLWKRYQSNDSKKKPTLADWDRVYAILTSAYNRRYFANRHNQLVALIDTNQPQSSLEAMLRLVLAEPKLSDSELFGKLSNFWPTDADAATLHLIDVTLRGTKPSNPSNQAKLINVTSLGRTLGSGGGILPPIRPVGAIGQTTTPTAALSAEDWQSITKALEQSWINRDGVPPLAQKTDWLNIYTSADATSLKADNFGGTTRWHTFGQGRKAPTRDQQPTPLLGWAVTSPVLCLSEGDRTVTLKLAFQAEGLAKDIAVLEDLPFQIEATTSKGWLSPTSINKIIDTDVPPKDATAAQPPLQTLQLILNFDQAAPPLAPLADSANRWPMIRLLLKSAWQESSSGGYYSAPYPFFRNLVLERVLINVNVTGLTNLTLENDNGPLPAGKPFEPFGFSPASGAGLQFVHPELVIKRLDWLQVNLEWMKVPAADLASYYHNYPAPNSTAQSPKAIIEKNSSFSAKFSLVDHKVPISLGSKALFDKTDATKSVGIKLDVLGAIQSGKSKFVYGPEFEVVAQSNTSAWPRYWRMELSSPDFQHDNYAGLSASMSVALASAIANSLKPGGPSVTASDYQVNPPYTPKLKSIAVDYESSVEIILTAPDSNSVNYGAGEERIYYFQAFGTAEIQPEEKTGCYRLLPSYDYEGELYIGLENVAPPQEVSILFQMAEGSANPDLIPQAVEWSYLSDNQWISLDDGGILADTTLGLIQSGIIKFRLDQADANTLLPTNLYWLRAAVKQDVASLSDTIAIHTQVVSATWLDQNNAQDHLNQPLAAETIRKTVVPIPGIAALIQPYTSFGGKPAELEQSFNLRVSERLRHKQRAVSSWDYEHLILEQFPGIYKAKCIPVTSNDPADLGKVIMVVIPDIRNQLPFNPFEPKVTAGQIKAIDNFLQGYLPPMAEVKVVNAHYVPVRVRFAVRFMPGCDAGYYKPVLNDELNRFLSPWAYQESNDVSIGGTIYANAIVDFLERRPYVDYVAELKLFKNEDGLGYKLVLNQNDMAGYRVQTDLPDGVLVADRQHDIDLIVDAQFEDATFSGIGYMKIELDFVVD